MKGGLTMALSASIDPATTSPEGLGMVFKKKGNTYLELLTTPNLHLYPIRDFDIYGMYETCQNMLWTMKELNMTEDLPDIIDKLTPDERYYILGVLLFFKTSDLQVLENCLVKMWEMIKLPEARLFYSLQSYFEAVHSETYSMLFDMYVRCVRNNNLEVSNITKDDLSDMISGQKIDTFKSIEDKQTWCARYMEDCNAVEDLPRLLLAFACVEGIFFSGAFAAIFHLKKRNLLRNLCKANEFISRDEGQHQRFGCMLYNKLKGEGLGLSLEDELKMIQDAVDIEKKFVCECLPVALIGCNKELMQDHIEFMGDFLLQWIGRDAHYFKECPFPEFSQICLERKTNFFEETVSEYQQGLSKDVELTSDMFSECDV